MINIIPTKILAKESWFKSISFSERIVNPKRDWNFLIILLVILVIVAVAFDYFIYRQIVSGDMYISINKAEITVQHLKVEELKKILNNFENKKTNIAAIKLEKLVDPSI